jgi:hypothetical protein
MGPIPIGTHVASASRHVLSYEMVPHESRLRDGCDLFQREPMSRLCLATFCVPYHKGVRQGCSPFKWRVSEVGCCPCSGFMHGCRFYSEW